MGKTVVDNTYHGTVRAEERMNLRKRIREKIIKDASRYGKSWQNMELGPLRDFVKSKGEFKRVKYFQGFIFIFQKNSTSLITLYPVPEEVLEEQKKFENGEKINGN